MPRELIAACESRGLTDSSSSVLLFAQGSTIQIVDKRQQLWVAMEARTELVGSDSWEYKRKSNWDLKATGGSRNQKTIVKTSEEAGTNPVLVE